MEVSINYSTYARGITAMNRRVDAGSNRGKLGVLILLENTSEHTETECNCDFG